MELQQMIKELEGAARRLGIQVRFEKGSFRGGHCVVGGQEVVVLNRVHPPEMHFSVLAMSLQGKPLETVFLPPVVRRAVEEVWNRKAAIALTEDGGTDDE